MSTDPQIRPRRSFGDLVKLASTPAFNPPADRDEGSGLVHLATLEAAEGGSSAPPVSAVTAKAEAVTAGASRWRPAMAGIALLGVLLVGALAGSLASTAIGGAAASRRPPLPPLPVPSGAPSARAASEETELLKLPLAAAVVDVPETRLVAPPQTVTRPSGREQSRSQGPRRSSAHASSNVTGPLAQATQGERSSSAPAQAAMPTPSTQSLADEIREAAGGEAQSPGTSSDEGAPSNPDGVAPLYPPIGAINSAMRPALWAAQACVDGDDPISHATIRFNSMGAVEAVTVTGWAAGKPAEACIRNALTKPRVAPFLQPGYAVPVTIRSN